MGKWTAADMPDLGGKVAVVTGANSGLGYYTARDLAAHGAHVVLACRGREKTEAAMQALKAEVPDAHLEFMLLDLADLDSVAAFASAFKARHPKLDILHNNAGVMALPQMRTKQGFDMQIGTNHLGHFALTGQLLDVLLAAPRGRVVSTASMAHTWTRGMDLDDLNWERKPYRKWDAYGKSKLANLLFAYELQRRLDQRGASLISVVAHPGYAATNLQGAGAKIENSVIGGAIMKIGNALFGQPAAMGALPQLYAATMPDVRGGEYFGPDRLGGSRGYPTRTRSNAASRDEAVAARLWALSEQLTGVRFLSA
ncbi:oxidoreductase [Solimonas terrae]|uniref:SDR family NAD(P)-dependent oxidoreductase n=1 Tax=Solimonas terrae TaxID=1396819 RepID=A0A6M2BP16_9GAMM|nr:oxidoreductase [Solimonas terrae]NGY03809.1 SDR family NAD(P)-dependent oxidoreductase [Solimonas terrae]